jgi:hypothetical protein
MRIISNEELVVVSGGGTTSSASALQDQEAREADENLRNMVDAFNNEKNRIYQPEATTGW